MKKLTFAKDMKAAMRKIDYMLKLDIDDPSMQVRWDAWNLRGDSIKELKEEWKACIARQQTFQKRSKGKGRPFKNTFLHISDDNHMDIDNLKFVNETIWKWFSRACGDMYMGLVAYHFKGASFHFHIGINPVPISQGLDYGMFRIAKNDTWWKNSISDAIMAGYAEASHALGFTTAKEMEKGIMGIPPFSSIPNNDNEHGYEIRPGYNDYFFEQRIGVIHDMRPGFISETENLNAISTIDNEEEMLYV